MSNLLTVQKTRDAVTKTAKLLARDKVEVRQQGALPHVAFGKDGRVEYVNLPVIPEQPTPEFLLAIQGFLDHEVAHVLFTNMTLAFPWYERAVSEGLEKDKVHQLRNAIEDIRIEREMAREFRGSAYNLTQAMLFVLEKIVEPNVLKALATPDERERMMQVLPVALMPFLRSRGGDATTHAFMDKHGLWPYFEVLDRLFPDLEKRIAALKDNGDSAALAFEFVKALTPPPPPAEEPPPPLGSADDGDQEPDEDGSEGGAPPEDDFDDDEVEEDDEAEGSDEEQEGSGAGGSDEESDSETHKEDDDAPEDDTPDDYDVREDDEAEADAEPEDGEGDEGDEDEEPSDEDADGEDEDPSEDEDADEPGGKKSNRSLTAAMKMLDPKERRALVMYNNKKKTVRAIAETMKTTSEDVVNLLKNARRNLKSLMGK